jgi:hypothetical protein
MYASWNDPGEKCEKCEDNGEHDGRRTNTNLANTNFMMAMHIFSVVSCDQRTNDLWNIPTNGPEQIEHGTWRWKA